MILVEGHSTPLSQGKQLCEILSKSNVTVVSYDSGKDYVYVCRVINYGLVTDFSHVCIVILTLEILPWFKVMTHPW